MKPAGKVASDRGNRRRGLVTESGRMRAEIAAVELGMLAAETDELHVGEAEPDGVYSNEDLILGRDRDVDPLGPAVAPDAFHALPVDVPSESAARGLPRSYAIPGVGLIDLRHFGRGRSAALTTRPPGSRIPTFVPVSSGFAARRSPASSVI